MTSSLNRLAYRRSLNRALRQTGPHDAPSMLELIKLSAPHVSTPTNLCDRVMASRERVLIAAPSTHYRETCLVLSYSAADGVHLDRAEWTARSFAGLDYITCDDARLPADQHRPDRPVLVAGLDTYSFLGQAFQFGRRNWGSELVSVNAKSVVTMRILEPHAVTGHTVLHTFTVGLSTPVRTILESVDTPPFDAFDQNVLTLAGSDDPVTAAEINGKNAYRVTYFDYCICGGPAQRGGCSCFSAGPQFAKQSPAPMRMPAAVVAAARSLGHRFQGDPIAALSVERAAWRPAKH